MTSPDDELRLWSASGAMALTGRACGPPMIGPGRPATATVQALARLSAPSWVRPTLPLPGVEILGERAAYGGLRRAGPWSCGGAFRVLPTRDGHVGLSLARTSDTALVPALTEAASTDPWADVERWLAGVTTQEADERIRLLGLPGGGLGEHDPSPPGVARQVLGRRRRRTRSPVVVDLSSLWAGPLCTSLLAAQGATVVKVESPRRPDPGRTASPDFSRVLNRGKRELGLDLTRDRVRLRELVAGADLVVVSARARAFEQLGLHAEDVVADGTSWLSITARGRASTAVGFGDDVAACAGHVVRSGPELLPVGDALADPLTGVTAAAAAVEALDTDDAVLLDVSMLHVAREALGATPLRSEQPATRRGPDGVWRVWTDRGEVDVRAPARRP